MKKETAAQMRQKAAEIFAKTHIVITPEEAQRVEIVDLGLDEIEKTGLLILVYENNSLYCAKEMAMLPYQTCPEHIHAPLPAVGYSGKQETFRCRWGQVTLYVEGEPVPHPKCQPPKGSEAYYTVWHEISLAPGEQYTIRPNTKHWFQAGPEGAVVSEFSTPSHDEYDLFTDPRIRRIPTEED